MGYLLKENMEVFRIDTFKSETFDLCLLDIMMPIKDGLTVATEIRKIDKDDPNLEIINIHGYGYKLIVKE
ncbi:MAG: hypothetical protein H8D45_03095 [Bacteroidetes bacterium]|nr:hypothetical protein [Bacteroidota bacterium]MBL7104403.1 hypothetical protein [Bacteroidales bacterium]